MTLNLTDLFSWPVTDWPVPAFWSCCKSCVHLGWWWWPWWPLNNPSLKISFHSSQVDLSLGPLAGWCGRCCLTQWDFFHGTLLCPLTTCRVGTSVRGHEADAGHFVCGPAPKFLPHGLGASIGHQCLLSLPLLVRHKGWEFWSTLGDFVVAVWRRHPAGIWVSELAALASTVSRHRHVGKRPQIWNKTQWKNHIFFYKSVLPLVQ